MSRDVKIVAGASSLIIGVLVFIGGFQVFYKGAVTEGETGGKGATMLGLLIMLAGLGLFLVPFVMKVAGWVKRYQAWKRTLTPEERGLVDAAEIAALWAGSISLHEARKRHNAHFREKLNRQRSYYDLPPV